MKLQSTDVTVERHGDMEETEFGIGDPWLIIEYLTKNVYSDIPRVIVQEIASNARDAHRETGQTRRIRISLPNRFDSTIKFRDFGPGINPQRMHEVFKKYGKSTKRGENNQTGGFGIGGKTPWAYADVFTMRSIAVENGKLMCREYSAIKAENRQLKLVEMGKPIEIDMNDPSIPDDDKHTGFTVSMDVKQNDWPTFLTKTIDITKHWKEEERPEISGINPTPEYPKMDIMYEGPGWKLMSVDQSLAQGRYNYSSNVATIVVDGIPYPLQSDSLALAYDSPLRQLFSGRFVYYFGIGELELALSRENLQYDERTKKAITDRLKEAHDALKTQINDTLKNCATLREAVIKYQKMQKTFRITEFVKDAEWNGFNVSKDHFNVNMGARVRQYKKELSATGMKIRSKEKDYFNVNENVLLCLHDTDQRSMLRIHTLFEENPNIHTIQVVEETDNEVAWKEFNKLTYFNEFSPRLMSTVEKMKRPKGSYGPGTVVKAYKFSGTHSTVPKHMWKPEDIDLEDGEGLYVTLERGISTSFYSDNICKTIEHLGKPVLIGVPERFSHKIGDGWKPLKDAVMEKIEEIKLVIDLQEISDEKHFEEFSATKQFTEEVFKSMTSKKFLNAIEDQSCQLVQWLTKSKIIERKNVQTNKEALVSAYIYLMMVINKTIKYPTPSINLEKIIKECEETYPLFFMIGQEYITKWNKAQDDLLFYVNKKNEALTSSQVAV